MNNIFKILIASFTFCLSAGTLLAALPSLAEARQTAKEQKKDVLVLCVGSDWLPGSDRFVAAFEAAQRKTKNSKVIWAIYDAKEKLTDEERKILGDPPARIWAYPGIIYMDSEGRPVDFRERATTQMLNSSGKFVSICSRKRASRDALWEKAEAASGAARAKLIGQGLDAFLDGMTDAKMRDLAGKYKNKVEEMKKADANDGSGYYFKYTFWYQPFMQNVVVKNSKEKNYASTFSYIDAKLSIPVLTDHQRQQLIIGKYKTALDQDKLSEAMKHLDDAIKINPKSELARGCANLKNYYTKPVRLDSLEWSGRDSRPRWTPTSVVVTDEMAGAGTYSVEFKHRGGHTMFQNPRIVSGKKILGKAEGEKRKFDISIGDVPAKKEVVLEFDMRGTGWFDGNGEIIIKKK